MSMDKFRTQYAPFIALLESELEAVRNAYDYCLCLHLVENEQMKLVETVPGPNAPICLFKATSGETVAAEKPPPTEEKISEVLDTLRGYSKDNDGS